MWPDNETDRDFLNFEGVADTIAEMIVRADDRPVSIGVSGDWGVGKSSMIKPTKASLEKHQPKKAPEKYLLVEFDAWLYQGYDDARAALLDVIAGRLEQKRPRERQVSRRRASSYVASSGFDSPNCSLRPRRRSPSGFLLLVCPAKWSSLSTTSLMAM